MVNRRRQSAIRGILPTAEHHIQGRVNAVDIKAFSTKVKQRLAVTAPDLQAWLTSFPDELRVWLRRERHRFQFRIGIGDDPRIEVSCIHNSLTVRQRPAPAPSITPPAALAAR